MAQTVELLSGGLVTARDASLLQPGELSVAEDVLLKPGSPSLHKAPGRRRFNTTALGSSITGLAYCKFDEAADLIAAVSGGSYYTAAAGETGTLASLATGAGSSLIAVRMLDRQVLLSGGTNKVLLNDGTVRAHGMIPVTSSPGLTHTASGGTWPLGAGQLGFFEYWTTEVYKSGDEDVESTFIGTPATVNVTSATSTVLVKRPGLANTSTTHWRAYRSNKKTNFADVAFPVGFLIAEVPIANDTFTDGASTAGTLQLGATTALVNLFSDAFYAAAFPKYGSDAFVLTTWVDPDNVLTDNAANATVTLPAATANKINLAVMKVTGFSFGTVNDPVTQIDVEIECSKSLASGALSVYLSGDTGETIKASQTVPATSSVVAHTITLPGSSPAVLQNPTRPAAQFFASDFGAGFTLYIVAEGSSAVFAVDYVKVKVTHSGTTPNQSTVFPNIIVSAGHTSSALGANALPPDASTGDIFQGSLVTNDVDNPREIAWTIPGEIDYSPAIYRLAFDFRVTCIRSLGQACLIGLDGAVERMNFLPFEEDPEFNTGRARDSVDSDDGMVGPNAACKFTLGNRLMLFYVGQTGLRMSDGYSAQTATDDIIWADMANRALLSKCSVENNALYHEILVHYPSAGSSAINKTLRLSYDPTHLKGSAAAPKLKVVGITDYAATSGCSGISESSERIVYTGTSAGYVYVENRGHTDASGAGIVPKVSTREMHLAGLGGAWELSNLGVHHQANGAADVDVVYSATQANYPIRTGATHTFTATPRRLSLIDGGEAGDGITVALEGNDDGLPLTIDYLLFSAEPLGETAPLKA